MMTGTLLGFDFGEKRIGVAVGETASGMAHPLDAVEEEAVERRFHVIERIVSEWKPTGFVVGRPRHPDGAPHEVARLAEKFGRRLAARFSLPVVFVDETLTSAEAESQLREQHARIRARVDIDALAAALILQSYIDHPEQHEPLPP